MSAPKTALILASGAMTGSYQCGVLKAFKEADMGFDVVIGSSVGAYNGARYLAGQMDICESIYLNDLTGDKFIKFANISFLSNTIGSRMKRSDSFIKSTRT